MWQWQDDAALPSANTARTAVQDTLESVAGVMAESDAVHTAGIKAIVYSADVLVSEWARTHV